MIKENLIVSFLGVFVSGMVTIAAEDAPVEKTAFSYRSLWPEFEAMRQFKDAGVNTVCIFAANTDNSLGNV